jgi:hypothetical protein
MTGSVTVRQKTAGMANMDKIFRKPDFERKPGTVGNSVV